MKTLYLIRHAKSSWDNHDISDFERDLNHRGKLDAPLMAKIIRQKKIKPDLIISSPAVRAINTANIFAGILDYPVEKIEANEKLYDAGLKELTDVVRNINDDKKSGFILFIKCNEKPRESLKKRSAFFRIPDAL